MGSDGVDERIEEIEQNLKRKHMQVDAVFSKTQEFLEDLLDAGDAGYNQATSRLLEACFWTHQNVTMQGVRQVEQHKEDTDDGRQDGMGQLQGDQEADPKD